MKKSFCIIYDNLGLGGIQTKIIDIINTVSIKSPNTKIFLILRRRGDVDRLNEIKNKNIQVVIFKETYFDAIPYFFPFICFYYAIRYHPISILAFDTIPSFCALFIKLIRPKTKVVISEDWSHDNEIDKELKKFPFFFRYLFLKIYMTADAVCAVNTIIGKELCEIYHIPKNKIIIIKNWHRPLLHDGSNTTAKKYSYDALYIGRLEPIKNIKSILHLLPEIIQKNKNFKFCIVGTGSEEQVLRIYVQQKHLSDHVVFTGFQKDISFYMNQSKLFILPSLSEGAPIVLFDAMRMGMPILCHNFPSAHTFIHHKKTGYIYTDKQSFLRYLDILLHHTDQQLKLGANARDYAKHHFSPKNINVYLTLLNIPYTP